MPAMYAARRLLRDVDPFLVALVACPEPSLEHFERDLDAMIWTAVAEEKAYIHVEGSV